MKELTKWLKEEADKIEYGTISLTVTKYQGSIVGIDKEVIDKQKFNPGKKVIDKK